MDDMTAFERQLSGGFKGLMGPSEPVDDLAVFESVTAASRSPRWGFGMFSALKFVVAAVIVALFGGFLLAGILTTQQEGELLPATVTESPSPTTTEDPLAGMLTEEVEPGVYRVLSDGVRDLASVEAVDIVAGHDGGIWLLREDEFLRLGSDGSHGWPAEVAPESHIFEVAPDGTMWLIERRFDSLPSDPDMRRGPGLRSTDGEEWTVQPCAVRSAVRKEKTCVGFTVAPDGTVWASWKEGGWRVGYLGPTGWQPLDGVAQSDVGPSAYGYRRLLFTDAGDLYGLERGSDGLYRYEEGNWKRLLHDEGDWWSGTHLLNADVGPDGTVWHDDGEEGPGLWRLADGEWAHWTAADLPGIRFGIGYDYQFQVAPDGVPWFSLWRSADGDPVADKPDVAAKDGRLLCDGLARFDGDTLDHYLPGRCITMDIAADGSIWVLAADEAAHELADGFFPDDQTWDLYVITPEAHVIDPEAVAATE